MVNEGTSLAEAKSCAATDPYFPCGWTFCPAGGYCLHEEGGGGFVQDTCLDAPAACESLSDDALCDCLAAQHPNLEPLVQSCTATPGGGVVGTTVPGAAPGLSRRVPRSRWRWRWRSRARRARAFAGAFGADLE